MDLWVPKKTGLLHELPVGVYRDKAGRAIMRGKDGVWHPTLGRYDIMDPDGSISERGEWVENLWADEGEQSVLNVYFLAASNPTKYLNLLQGTPGETTTMGTMTESPLPGVNGYARQQINSGDWGAAALDSGDYMTTASAKTFGAASGSNWTSLTYVGLVTTASDTSGKFLAAIALSGTTTVAVGQSLIYTLSMKCQ